jgi:hypothetical protein
MLTIGTTPRGDGKSSLIDTIVAKRETDFARGIADRMH